MDYPFEAPLVEISRRLAEREFSALELARAMLARIEALDCRLHSYASVAADLALDAATRADATRQNGAGHSPLLGVPIGLKDIIAAAGVPTHVGSVVYRNWQPGMESCVARRLREAGAVLLGKHQTTEAASGAHHSSITAPLNPLNDSAWTGVSSSGSAVAVAAGLSYGSFGTDTGGSIRFPSHCCGLVGLKPTWGRVSRYGVFPLAESFDHVGPIARSVADVALLFEAVAGRDDHDPTSLHEPVTPWHPQHADPRGLRVGYDPDYCNDGLDPAIAAALGAAAQRLRDAGAEIVPIEVPRLEDAVAAWLTLCASEAVQAHAASYPARATEFGAGLAALLEFGRRIDAAEVRLARTAARAATRSPIERHCASTCSSQSDVS